jgi:integral membrane sensor domain MASE1
MIQLILLPLLYYIGVKLSLALAVLPEVVVMLWIPNSVLLAGLIHYKGRRYVFFAGLIVLAEIAADYPTFALTEAAAFGAINILEVSLAYLLLRYWRFDSRFATPADIAKFIIAGPTVSAFFRMRGGDRLPAFQRCQDQLHGGPARMVVQ